MADADRKNGLQDDLDGEFEGDDELNGDRYNPDEDERRMRVSVAKNRKYRVEEASNLLRGGMGVMPRQFGFPQSLNFTPRTHLSTVT